MADSKFCFVHYGFTKAQFQELTGAVRWLLESCPMYSPVAGTPFPNAPLNGQLVTANYVVPADSSVGEWQTRRLFQHDGTDNPISMVDGAPAIVVNGRKSFGMDYLTIGEHEMPAWQTVDTGGLPYTVAVAAILLLANHLCPQWSIASSVPDDVWTAALAWVQDYDADITLPSSVAPAAQTTNQKTTMVPSIQPPLNLDFRA